MQLEPASLLRSNIRSDGEVEQKRVYSKNPGPIDSSNYAFRAVVLTLGPSQIVGLSVLLKSLFFSLVLTKDLGQEGAKYLCLRESQVDFADKQKEILTKIKTAFFGLKEKGHSIISSTLSAIPVVGLFGAGLYSKYVASDSLKSINFKECCAEAISQHILGQFLPMIPWVGLDPKKVVFARSGGKLKDNQARAQSWSKFEKIIIEKGAKALSLPVKRGDGKAHTISCYHIVQEDKQDACTMILFNPNGGLGTAMCKEVDFYKSQGWNVLLMQLGGYPGSDEGLNTTEITTIQDAYAMIRYLEELGVKKMGVHGQSLGGSMAMHATQLSGRVKIAVLNQTFDNVRNLSANSLTNTFKVNLSPEADPCIPKSVIKSLQLSLPPAVVKGAVGSAFPVGKIVPCVIKPDGSNYFTDGLDSVRKVRLFTNTLICIGAGRDFLMGYDKVGQDVEEEPQFSRNFAENLIAAHTPGPGHSSHLCIMPGAVHGDEMTSDIRSVVERALFAVTMQQED